MSPKKPKVAIAMPAYGTQYTDVIVNTNELSVEMLRFAEWGGFFVEGVSNVDINRNKIVKRILETDAEYIWWIDADNLPPVDSLRRLLDVGKPLVSGLYYGGNLTSDIIPVAYLRRPDGAYHALHTVYQWERGEIVPVDAVGMGCFLTHRDVFTDIENNFVDVQAFGGWRFTVHKDDLKGELPEQPKKHPYGGTIHKGTYYLPVYKPTVTGAPFPHFQCQFTRTEDFVFCENAKRLGYEILVDTSVEVGHQKHWNVTGKDFRKQKGLATDPTPQEEVYV